MVTYPEQVMFWVLLYNCLEMPQFQIILFAQSFKWCTDYCWMYFVNADAASKTTDYKTDWLHFYAVYHPFSQQNKLHFDLATDWRDFHASVITRQGVTPERSG